MALQTSMPRLNTDIQVVLRGSQWDRIRINTLGRSLHMALKANVHSLSLIRHLGRSLHMALQTSMPRHLMEGFMDLAQAS